MNTTKTSTYRERIQALRQVLIECYDEAGILRDYAEGYEKEYFNTTRGTIGDVCSKLSQLDNRMKDDRASMITIAKALSLEKR